MPVFSASLLYREVALLYGSWIWLNYIYMYIFFFNFICMYLWGGGPTAQGWFRPPPLLRFLYHSEKHKSVRTPLNASSQKPLPAQHTTNSRDRHPCHQRDLNPQSQQQSGLKTTPWTARPPRFAIMLISYPRASKITVIRKWER